VVNAFIFIVHMLQTKWGTLSLNDIISFLEEMKESNTDIQVVVFNEEKDRIVEIQ